MDQGGILLSKTYTDVEQMICLSSRLIEDNRTVFVGYGMPQIAAILAQKLYSPNICQVYEYGAIGPEVATPFKRNMMADARNSYRSYSWMSMNRMMAQAQMGYIDYERPKKRFTGSGGGNEVASLCWKTIVLMQHEKRRFLEKVDYITSPGFLDGPGARENAGLPRDSGPHRVVSSKALFDFDEDSKVMRLIGLCPGATREDVLENMEFEPVVAGKLEQLGPPTEDELKILREEIDPDRVVIGRI
jgi:glutaconate CoA-transferase subunit B